MADLTIGVDDWTQTGAAAAAGRRLTFQPVRMDTTGPRVLSGQGWSLRLDGEGEAETTLPPARPGMGVRITASIIGWRAVTVAGYPDTVTLAELLRRYVVDPGTLDPGAPPPASWWTALGDLTARVEELAARPLFPPAGGVALEQLATPVRGLLDLAGTALQELPADVVRTSAAPAVRAGLVGWSYDSAAAVNNSPITLGQLLLVKVWPDIAAEVGTVTFGVSNTPAGAAGTFAGLYSAGGLLLAESPDVSAQLNATSQQPFSVTLSHTLILAPDAPIYAAILVRTATTPPSLARASSTARIITDGTGDRVLTYGTGLTALPAQVPLASAGISSTAFYASIRR